MLNALKKWWSKPSERPSLLTQVRSNEHLLVKRDENLKQWITQQFADIDENTWRWAKHNATKIPTITIESLPRPPGHLPALMAQFKSGAASAHELADKLRQDPNLSSNLMKVINSPLYRTYHKCQSIEDALVRLGADGFTALVTTAIAQPLSRQTNSELNELQTKSWELAAIACQIGEYQCLQHSQPSIHGFMAVMADEIALLASAQVVGRATGALSPLQTHALLYEHYLLHRLRISSNIAELWNLDAAATNFCITAIAGESHPGQLLAQAQLGALLLMSNETAQIDDWCSLGLGAKLFKQMTEQNHD